MAFDWSEKLLDTVLGGLPMAAVMVPQQRRKRAAARLRDVNPFSTVVANEDLLRALRLAWIEAALQIDSSVLDASEAAEWHAQGPEVRRLSGVLRSRLRALRAEAFNREVDPGSSPIDVHLHELIVAVPAAMRRRGPSTGQALTDAFCPTVAAVAGWPLVEIPALYGWVASDGLPLPGAQTRRSFGELVYAEFAETIKSPDRYPEARQAFVIAIAGLGVELAQQTLAVLRGQGEQLDRLVDTIGVISPEGGLPAWLARVDVEWGRRLDVLTEDVRTVGEKVGSTHSEVVALKKQLAAFEDAFRTAFLRSAGADARMPPSSSFH